ncbi:cytochrome c family protein [Phenylobacterium sp.]|uniref:c-type cytochrome n=1 Tax=Phenylobacterium sp. TaxID=1871053 RepID=UPI002E321E99|nr:cytochrome c family protein [Phenylobacterium sp.]HEX2560351.1 cytochrome c family protein [Phenylobacterium sp.]
MDLTFNKVAGAVLATGLALVGLRELANGVFAVHEVEKPGYAIAVAEEAAGGGEAELPPDWGTVLPVADVAAGQAVFAKCTSCHVVAAGAPHGTGPNLYGVVGRKPAGAGGYAYSQAFTDYAGQHPVWTWEELDAFLRAPQKHIPGTKMTFVGLKKQEDRINMLAYLAQQGGTLAVPPPNPAAAAAPAAAGAAAPAAEGAAPAAPGAAAPATEGAAAPAAGAAAPAGGAAAPAAGAAAPAAKAAAPAAK